MLWKRARLKARETDPNRLSVLKFSPERGGSASEQYQWDGGGAGGKQQTLEILGSGIEERTRRLTKCPGERQEEAGLILKFGGFLKSLEHKYLAQY